MRYEACEHDHEASLGMIRTCCGFMGMASNIEWLDTRSDSACRVVERTCKLQVLVQKASKTRAFCILELQADGLTGF